MDHQVAIKEEPVCLEEAGHTSLPFADIKDEIKIEEGTVDQLVPFVKNEIKCFETVTYQKNCFKSFWEAGDKLLQDAALLGYMKKKEKTFQKQDRSKNRDNIWSYCIKVKHDEMPVCRQFLLSVFQISEMRLRTVQQSLRTGTVLEDHRGKHNNRPNKIADNVWQLVEEHWGLIPHREAHYSRAKTNRKYFENPELNVVKLYTAFKQYYYDKVSKPLRVGYSAYHKYFRENSEYSFRQPKTDMCDYCAECEIALKGNPGHDCKNHYLYHKKRVEAYNGLKRELLNSVKNEDSDILVLEFDYAQNLPLPRLNVTAQFYKHLLWLYNFNVHCHNDGSSAFYCFLESDSKKNPNSVCSFLHDFLTRKLQEMPIKRKVVLLSDSCGSQNKNNAMVMFSAWLSNELKVEIEHIFPVRGHSFSQCDRNFGKYGILLKQVECIETCEEYLNIMKDSKKLPEPFSAVMASHLIKDWVSALRPMFLRMPSAKSNRFMIQKFVRLYYHNGVVSGSQSYTPNYVPFTFLKRNASFLSFNDLKLLDVGKCGVKADKRLDVLSLMKYLKPENVQRYETVMSVCDAACEDESS